MNGPLRFLDEGWVPRKKVMSGALRLVQQMVNDWSYANGRPEGEATFTCHPSFSRQLMHESEPGLRVTSTAFSAGDTPVMRIGTSAMGTILVVESPYHSSLNVTLEADGRKVERPIPESVWEAEEEPSQPTPVKIDMEEAGAKLKAQLASMVPEKHERTMTDGAFANLMRMRRQGVSREAMAKALQAAGDRALDELKDDADKLGGAFNRAVAKEAQETWEREHLDIAEGEDLDRIAHVLGVSRVEGETDDNLRIRMSGARDDRERAKEAVVSSTIAEATKGDALDRLASTVGLHRHPREDDESLRARIQMTTRPLFASRKI